MKNLTSKQLKTKQQQKVKPKVLKPKVVAPKIQIPDNLPAPGYSVFTDQYPPAKPIGREKEIAQLEKEIKTFAKTGYANSLLISGATGLGKTTTLKYVLNKIYPFSDKEEDNKDNKYYVFVGCKGLRSTRNVLAKIGNIKPSAHDTSEKILPEVIESIKKNRKLICLDDIDDITEWASMIDLLNEPFRQTGIPIFVATNEPDFINKIPDDAARTFYFKEINFDNYNKDQILAIIKERLAVVKRSNAIPNDTLDYIARTSAEEGSVRLALDLLSNAFRSGARRVEEIEKLTKSFVNEDYFKYLRSLPTTERKALGLILERFNNNPPKGTGTDLTTISNEMHLSMGRVSQLVASLNTKYKFITIDRAGNSKLCKPEQRLIELTKTQDSATKIYNILQ